MPELETDKITIRRARVILEGALREAKSVRVVDAEKMSKDQIVRMFVRYIGQTKQAIKILGGDPDAI